MTPEPYAVKPGTSIENVASEMAEHKYGCAVVEQENGKVVGIFTATDGMIVLARILAEHYRKEA
jgi:acetoin utilization protein AcuB